MKFVFIFIFFLLFAAPVSFAQGDLSVVPRRVIFENGNKRSETLYLTNRGKDSATYNLEFLNYKVDDLGNFTAVSEDSLENPASKNLRFFPRRVTLAPNQTQTVKLQLRQFADLPDGEYRSHLLFKGVPSNNALSSFGEVSNSEAVGIKLKAIYGLTIPNIVRKGKYGTSVTIENLKLQFDDKNKRKISFDIIKKGNYSIYGALSIDYLYGDGSLVNLGEVPGIAIYANNISRSVNMFLPEEYKDISEGNIQVTITSKEERNINDIIAEAVLKL